MSLRKTLETYFEALRDGPAPLERPFVRRKGETLEPLLLALPLDIWREISTYLNFSTVSRLVTIGSPLLTDILQRRGGISRLKVDYLVNNLQTRFVSYFHLGAFSKLTHFELKPSRPYLRVLGWKINALPPTLTHLHVELAYPLISFLRRSTEDLMNSRDFSLDYMTGIHWNGTKPTDLWFPLAELFPKLKYLAILGRHQHNMLMSQSFLQILPMDSLETLNVNFLRPWLPSDRYHAAHLWRSIMPPNLSSIFLYAPDDHILSCMPERITSLHLAGRHLSLDDLEPLKSLLELRLEHIVPLTNDNQAKQVLKLPRGLQLLHCANFLPFDWYVTSDGEFVKAMPRTLTSWRTAAFPSAYLKHLPPTLTDFHFANMVSENSHIADLPRGLRTLHVNGFQKLDAESVVLLPSSLTELVVHYSHFSDAWIPQLLPNLRSITAQHWQMTGLLLRPDVDRIDSSALVRSAENCPIIQGRVQIHPATLLYLPPALQSLENQALSPSIPYASLPRHMRALPSSYAITDGKQDLADLPQHLSRITVLGNIRYNSWIKIPVQVPSGDPTVIAEAEDVRVGLQIIGARPLAHNKLLSIPDSILDCLMGSRGLPEMPHLPPKRYALWKPEHYRLLHESLESLSLSLPPQYLDLPWLGQKESVSTIEKAMEPVELPSTLTSLSVTAPLESTHKRPQFDERFPTPFTAIVSPASTLARACLTLSILPLSLTNLEIHGRVDIEELADISRFLSLKSLTLGLLLGSDPNEFADEAAYSKLLSQLPESLKSLYIKYLPAATTQIGALPRGLRELSIESQPVHYKAAALSALPPRLKKLRINAIDLPKDYKSLLPACLTDPELAWGRRVKAKPQH